MPRRHLHACNATSSLAVPSCPPAAQQSCRPSSTPRNRSGTGTRDTLHLHAATCPDRPDHLNDDGAAAMTTAAGTSTRRRNRQITPPIGRDSRHIMEEGVRSDEKTSTLLLRIMAARVRQYVAIISLLHLVISERVPCFGKQFAGAHRRRFVSSSSLATHTDDNACIAALHGCASLTFVP